MIKVVTRRRCDECPNGEMKSTGMGFVNSRASYNEHKCDQCGKVEQYENANYPGSHFEFNEHEIKTIWIEPNQGAPNVDA